MRNIYIVIDLEDIFVGRHKELSMLEDIWKKSLTTRHEHKAYVIFNSPGVGKTTLIRKFGEMLENSGRGIHFNYVCNSKFTSHASLLRDILTTFIVTLETKEDFITEFIRHEAKPDKHEILIGRFYAILSEANSITNINEGDLVQLFRRLSHLIPIFYSSDEIQNFEQQYFTNNDETLLHYYSGFIKSFLTNRILLVMTGTQHHILRELGDKIGSPLRGKALSKIISPLQQEDITEYCAILEEQEPNISSYSLEYLKFYLQTFSGGHGRTIYYIISEFLEYYSAKYSKIMEYIEFQELLTKYLRPILVGLELTQEKKDTIKQLQSSIYFTEVQQWINQGLYRNFSLGSPPEKTQAGESNKFDDIVYKFMTIGIITQNGNNDYYITSYFHYLTFLELIIGEYESFLREILYNKHFRSLVGGHSGFGYTFENVLLATLIINSNKVESFPLQVSQIVQIAKKINYANLKLQSGLLYHTPYATNIDAITLYNTTILALQITTQQQISKSKLTKFHAELDKIRQTTNKEVTGWFISLFPIYTEIPSDLNIIQGTDLIKFMNKSIYEKLTLIKKEII